MSKVRRFRRFAGFVTGACVLIGFVGSVHADAPPVLRVDGDSGSPNPLGLGTDWGPDAYKFLQDALTRAQFLIDNEGANTVWLWVAATVPNNPYSPDRSADNPNGSPDRTKTFNLLEGVEIYGGFLGTDHPSGGETIRSQRDPLANETILSGDIAESIAPLVCGDPLAGDCLVANGTPGCDDADCCALVCAAMPECCTIEWDVFCRDLAFAACGTCGDPLAGDCFVDNGTPGCNDVACCAVVCEDDPFCCSIEWVQECADLALQLCGTNAFHVVTAVNVDDTALIDGFTITEGLANGLGSFSEGFGGGMFVDAAGPTVLRCKFTANAAQQGGGMYNNNTFLGGQLRLINCSFIGNSEILSLPFPADQGEDGGGAIYNKRSSPLLVNCLFVNNSATDGGGGAIHNCGVEPAAPILINCTLFNNSAADLVGGIFNDIGGSATVINCILWANQDSTGLPSQAAQINGDPTIGTTVIYSDVQGLIAGGDFDKPGGLEENIDADPLFQDPAADNYRLASDSPCIDTGNPDATVIPADEFDLNGDLDNLEPTPELDLNGRVVDADNVIGAVVDMGAYEFCPCAEDCQAAPSGSVDVPDLLALLGAWGGPQTPGTTCDLDGNGTIEVPDLLALLAKWGLCQCSSTGSAGSELTLEEEFLNAGLDYPEDWNLYLNCIETGTPEEAYNCQCWFHHYLHDDCPGQTCPYPDPCPGLDPFDGPHFGI